MANKRDRYITVTEWDNAQGKMVTKTILNPDYDPNWNQTGTDPTTGTPTGETVTLPGTTPLPTDSPEYESIDIWGKNTYSEYITVTEWDNDQGKMVTKSVPNPDYIPKTVQTGWDEKGGATTETLEEALSVDTPAVEEETVTTPPISDLITSEEEKLLPEGDTGELGEGDVPIYDPGVTQLEKDLEEVLYGQMSGDIPKLTSELVEEKKDILRPTYGSMSEAERTATAEKYRTAGRLRGSRHLYEQEKLKSMQEGRITEAAIAQANTELGRIDAAVGRGLAAGLTFSEMETKKEQLTAEQKYGLGMYQVKVRDQAKLYFSDQRFKEHWSNLERAWAEEDWDEYAKLSKELTSAGMPDMADYLLSMAPYLIMALI